MKNRGIAEVTNNNLLILCNSLYGEVAKEIAESMKKFDKVDILTGLYGVLDNNDKYREIGIGNINDCENYVSKYSYAIAVFEDVQERLEWNAKLVDAGFKIVSIISPEASVSPSAQIENGCVVKPMARVGANSILGECTILKTGAVLEYGCAISKGCYLNNYCVIKTGAYVEPNRTVERFRVINSFEEDQKIRNEYN